MAARLTEIWTYLAGEVWQPLSEFTTEERATPLDLFSDLLDAADDSLEPPLSDLSEIRNDPIGARERFLGLAGSDFEHELAVVEFLERVKVVLDDYDFPELSAFYTRLIEHLFEKFSLRYRVEDPFSVRILLPGWFWNLYLDFLRLGNAEEHLADLFEDFEKAFDRYSRTSDDSDLRNCIAKVSNFAEGAASSQNGSDGMTLGRACDRLSVWPHDKVRDAIKDLYGFTSDYPGIRHAGNRRHKRRDLGARDLAFCSFAMFGLAGYLSKDLDESKLFGP
jgi:hypothetical protein